MNDRVSLIIIAGMPRTATTFLYQRFLEHPSIFCPYRKETNFFSVNYGNGVEWYRGLFASAEPGQIGADVSPAYFLDPSVVERMRAYDPRPRIVLGVRRASEWALSWYTQVLTHRIRAKPTFEEFCTGYTFEISGGEIWQDFRAGFVRHMIERYRTAFNEDVLLYDYRAFRTQPLSVINSIESFLGVPKFFSEENFHNEIVNAGTRRNIGLITYLVSREGFVDAVGRFLPRRLVQVARSLYVKTGSTRQPPPPPTFTDQEKAYAARLFAADDAWIDSLFARAPIQLGTGEPFDAGSVHEHRA